MARNNNPFIADLTTWNFKLISVLNNHCYLGIAVPIKSFVNNTELYMGVLRVE